MSSDDVAQAGRLAHEWLTEHCPNRASGPALTPPQEIPESGLNIAMVDLPGGCDQRGSPSTEQHRREDERQHQVCVKAFAIGKTEVTQAQWQTVVGNNPSEHNGCDACAVGTMSAGTTP